MKNFMKRLSSLVMAGLLVFCLVPAASATEVDPDQQLYTVEDLGNGITRKTTITVEPAESSLTRATHTREVTSDNEYEMGGVVIATVSFTVTFKYDGNRSWVDSTSYSKSLKSGWTYSNHKIQTFGGSANLTATLKKSPSIVPVDISLRCSPSGAIS